MNVSEFLSGDFMRAEELTGKPPLTVTIKTVEKKDLQGEAKLVLSFHESDRQLTLNKTRLKHLVKKFGPETVHWTNQPIALIALPISSGRFAGQSTITIIDPPAQQPAPQPAQPGQGQQWTGWPQQDQPAPQAGQEVAFKV